MNKKNLCENPVIENTRENRRLLNALARFGVARWDGDTFVVDWQAIKDDEFVGKWGLGAIRGVSTKSAIVLGEWMRLVFPDTTPTERKTAHWSARITPSQNENIRKLAKQMRVSESEAVCFAVEYALNNGLAIRAAINGGVFTVEQIDDKTIRLTPKE